MQNTKPQSKNWQRIRVRDLLSGYIGGGWGSDSKTTEFSEPAFVIRGTDIPDVSVGDTGSLPFRYHKKSNIKSRRLSNGDIVFEVSGGSKGQWVGRSLIIKSGLLRQLHEDVVPASFCKGLTPDSQKVDSVFFYYFLQKIYQSDEISQWQTQSTGISNFKFEKFLDECFINLPSKPTQEQIAQTLSAYDDLIENNTRRIKILEETAQTIYREWFVYFRFPGHEKVKMIDSKTEFGKIPAGWKVGKLSDLATIIMGQSPSSNFYNESGEGLPFHQGVTNFGFRFPATTTYSTEGMRRADMGDILFSVRAPVGRINVADRDMIIGRGLASMKSISGHQSFLFYQLKHHFQTEDLIGGGAIFASVTKDDLNNFSSIIPDASVVDGFEQLIRQLDGLIFNISSRLSILKNSRDLFLLKLVTGEIEVKK